MLADRKRLRGSSGLLAGERLIGDGVLEQRGGVDAGFVAEGVGSGDGLGAVDGPAGVLRYQLAERIQPGRVQPGLPARGVTQGHDHFLKRSVAGPLAQSIHRDAGRICAALDGGKRVGRGHAQVVVAVEFERQLAAGNRPQPAETTPDLVGVPNSDRVGDAHAARAGIPGGEDEAVEQRGVGARSVLRADGHVPEAGARLADDLRKNLPKPALLLAEGAE